VFYGACKAGGANGNGTVFSFTTPANTLTTLHSFSSDPGGINADGAQPYARLTPSSAGGFFGACYSGGANGVGEIYSISSSGAFSVVQSLLASQGSFPRGGLVQGANGSFYGACSAGGAANRGSLFSVSTGGAVSMIYSFQGSLATSDGASANGALIQGSNNSLYGTCEVGGANAMGALFKITPGGAFTTLHSFGGAGDGASPAGGILQAADGNYYGACAAGGTGNGTIFKLTPAGTVTTLYSFGAPPDGASPTGSLVQGADGNLYGTCQSGGANGSGSVFKLTLAGVETTVYSFSARAAGGVNSDGATPLAGLVSPGDGNFYGTCSVGGATDYGTVYKITPGGSLTPLHSFSFFTDGGSPASPLCAGSDGKLYGTCSIGTATGYGSVFSITTGGAFNMLYSFNGLADGRRPTAGLIQATDGNFYGLCSSGGPNDNGTIFRITSSGTLTTESDLPSGQSVFARGGLLEDRSGNLYGGSLFGGANHAGSIFKLVTVNRDDFNLDNAPDVAFQRTDTGDLAYWLLQMANKTAGGVFSPSNPGSAAWRLAGLADIDGDSSTDLIWQNSSTGDLAYFLMNSVSVLPSKGIGFFSPRNPGNTDWRLVSVVDLNGDFSPDLIFQSQSTGDVAYWLMNGTSKASGGLFTPTNPGSASWKVAAAIHNYASNDTTIVFQNSQTGVLAYWQVNSAIQQTGAGLFSPSNPGNLAWLLVGVPDLNGDGWPD
ncbi:MAG TPA: choice-of-anchor tandem repeat GloVer-containing protein, partial [Chthonomonadales bacterium]|nr:choice-of-anchor tandem repeat GloVer-containing protein [Chthonomonadales bacterium]